MRKVVVSEFISLDGVIEDPGGAGGFDRGGWSFQFDRGPEGDKFKFDEVMASDALLLGRTTYQGFAEAWPSREGEFADKFSNMPKYVVSTTLEEPLGWNNSVLMKSDEFVEGISELKRQPGKDITIIGSGALVRSLLEEGLLDELRLMVHPVVLGSGKRLFEDGGDRRPLELVDSKAFGTGVQLLTYRPARGTANRETEAR